MEELLEYYNDVIEKFDSWSGLELNNEDSINNNVIFKYIMKANDKGAGLAYVSGNEIETNCKSIREYIYKSWTTLHEIGHRYEAMYSAGNTRLGDVLNNIFAH